MSPLLCCKTIGWRFIFYFFNFVW